jgi:hypothetical protein
MARPKKSKLKRIELISKTKGVVKEYNLDHAIRILDYQKRTGQGSQEIFNTLLYQYDQGAITIRSQESITKGHSTNRGELSSETLSADVVREDQKPEEQE